jgi:hypothetical protein
MEVEVTVIAPGEGVSNIREMAFRMVESFADHRDKSQWRSRELESRGRADAS